MDQSIINFKVYEDSVEYVGMAQATLPDLTALTQSISGAGIAGNVESVILGHFDAMTLGLNFRTVTDQSVKLSEPRRHTIDLRVAQQDEDVVAGKVVVRAVKHILVVIPKSDKGGSVAPAAPSNGSGEYAVRYACVVRIEKDSSWKMGWQYTTPSGDIISPKRGSKGVLKFRTPLLRQDNCTLNPNWYVAKCDVPPWSKPFLPHYCTKQRDAPKQGIPLHIIFEVHFTPRFYPDTSFSIPPTPFVPLHSYIAFGSRVRGIGQKNQ